MRERAVSAISKSRSALLHADTRIVVGVVNGVDWRRSLAGGLSLIYG